MSSQPIWLLKSLMVILQKDTDIIAEGLSLPSCTKTYIFDFELRCKMHWQELVSHVVSICNKMLWITRHFFFYIYTRDHWVQVTLTF